MQYPLNSYQFSIEGEIILFDCLCLLSHILIFTILLMFCGCFGVEFLNRTISFKIKHNGPIQFRVKLHYSVVRFMVKNDL